MNIQKIDFCKNQTKLYANKNKPSLYFQRKDNFETEKEEKASYLEYKYDEKTGDFCFKNKEYDAAAYYYESALNKLKTYFEGDIKESIKKSRKDSAKYFSYKKEYEKYREELEEYNSSFFILKLLIKAPKKPENPDLNYDLALFNKNIIILSNLYNKIAMSYFALNMNDDADEYLKKSKEILKQALK